MAVTAAGRLSLPLDNLQDLIANSGNFQTWTGTANAAAAKARIHVQAEGPSYTRPAAIVSLGPDDDWRSVQDSAGAAGHYVDTGMLRVQFEANVASGNQADHTDALYEFTNNVGAIIDDMLGLAGSDTYLVVHEIRKTDGPGRIRIEDVGTDADEFSSDGDAYGIEFTVMWGP